MSKLKTGILITTILSVLSLPLSYVRNWILSQFGEIMVADFAIVLLLSSIVSTFFLFGASTVYSIYIPKLDNKQKKVNFIISASILSLVLLILGSLIVIAYPTFTISYIDSHKDFTKSLFQVIFFFFVFGLGQMVMYALIGLREYKISAYLNFTQPFIVVVFLFFIYFFNGADLITDSFSLIIISISCIWIINILVGAKSIFYNRVFKYSWFLPKGFWRQAIYVHLGTVLTFLYGYVDQILVLSYLGKNELATYFLTIQVARLVNFISLKLLQVFQSSFAASLKNKTNEGIVKLKNLYNEIAKYNLFISFGIAVFLVLFGDDIMLLFSKTMSFNSQYLFYLVLTFFIGSLGGIHSQVIQAKEENETYFLNNVFLVVIQVALSIYLVKDYGVLGIISARFITTFLGQIGLVYILKRKCDINLYSPYKYLGLIVLIPIIYYFLGSNYSILFKSIFFVLIMVSLLKVLKINIKKLWVF